MITQDGTLLDGARSYALGIATLREMRVRRGEISPGTPRESRWAAEGAVPAAQLDTVREWTP